MTAATVSCRPARDSALIVGRNLRVLRKNPGRMIYPLIQPLVLQALLLLAVARLLGSRVQQGVLGVAGTIGVTVVFALGVAVLSAWLALLVDDPETAERVLFFPAIALAFISSAFAPIADLAGRMQPLARANPVTAAAAAIRSLASGGPIAVPLLELGCWAATLTAIPGFLAARRWNAPR